MNGQGNDMSRRDFIKAAGVTAALGGGLVAGALPHAQASPAPGQTPYRWSAPWRPASPRRLPDRIHELARLGLTGEHGRSMKNAGFALDAQEVADLSADLRYAHAARMVAERAPLRVLPGEKIVGSATLLEAPGHMTPVAGVPSTSHTTIGYHNVLKTGYKGLRRQIEERLARGGFDANEAPDYLARLTDGWRPGTQAFNASPMLSHWAEAPHRPEFDGPPLTVECRARLHSCGNFNVIVLNRQKESRKHWEIYSYMKNGFFSAYLPGYAPAEIVSDRVITDGQWHQLAMTFSGERVRLFVDGEMVKEQAVRAAGDLPEGGGSLYVGGLPTPGIPCDGQIAEVRISRAIRKIRPTDEPLAVDPDTVALWNFAPGEDGARFADASGSGNDLLSLPKARSRGKDLLEAMLLCLDAAAIWHGRYMDELARLAEASTGEERENYLWVRENLRHVPENPPRTFAEAVQSLWFMYAFQRLMGNWTGIGRIDEMLGGHLERDLAEGRITRDEARELIANFWIKGTEWAGIGAFGGGTGDAQFYQNIILAGIDADGREVANEVTYLILDVVEELHISDFPIAVRINRHTPGKLLRRIAEVQRHGGGIVAFYNEEVVLDGLVKFGYDPREARTFTNDGCWEVLIPGRTAFSYMPFDGLALLHEALGLKDTAAPAPDYTEFDALYAAFLARLEKHIDWHHDAVDNAWTQGMPAPLISMMVPDCIESGRGYYDRGARYNVVAPHIGGIANIANSLLVIQKLVYEEKSLLLAELVEVLRNNWDGQEPLRRLILKRFPAYGNDAVDADTMMVRVFDDYTGLVGRIRERNGVLRPAGISTFGREIGWRGPDGGRSASPDGHFAEEILATNCSPSPGSDLQGPTAVLKSYCKMDFTRSPNGATVELKVHPESVRGENGVEALVALARGFQRMGGMFMHIDVVDSALLIDAQLHPDKYPNLSVRVAGWSARFATLNKDWQTMVIQRTQQVV